MLTGKTVKIRPLEKTDLALFYQWLGNQEHIGSFMDVQLTYRESFVEGMEVLFKDNSKLYAMIESHDAVPLGIMNWREVAGSASTLELGILIAECTARGKGLGSECLALFTDHLFTTKRVMRLQFLCRVENTAMRAAGEKTGFMLEGVLKKYKFEQGDYRDYCLMAITRDDWSLKNDR